VGGIAQLHADREIKARRTAAKARNLHAPPPILLEARASWQRSQDISSLNI
jgi:hypothetical protein